MRDVYVVLSGKEQDVERVRKEIQALLTVIPLLVEDEPSSDAIYQLLLSSRPATDSDDKGMAQLERYYPFVKNMRTSEK
jgi:hypothetical protein